MKYRWKLLALLLLISFLPIFAGRTFGVRAVRHLANEMIKMGQERMIIGAEQRMRLLVDAYAQYLRTGREKLETVLLIQAQEVGRALDCAPPNPQRVYFSDDFETGGDRPADSLPSPMHSLKREGSDVRFLDVSRSAQVFHLPPGADRKHLTPDIARLSAMTPFYRKLSHNLAGMVLWHYTVLDNGVHAVYPAHGKIPADLDVRIESWFQNPPPNGTPWTNPYQDPETGQIVVSAIRSVTGADGKPIGATMLVVPISRLLDQRLLVQNIPPGTRLFLCYVDTYPDGKKKGARIFASDHSSDSSERSWQAEAGDEWLISENRSQYEGFLEDVQSGQVGVRNMPFDGAASLWAYGPIYDEGFIAVIMPEVEILKPAVAIKERVEAIINDMLEVTRLGMVGIVVIVVILALTFSLTVTRPIQKLMEGSLRLSEGRFDTRVDIRSNDEFGKMGQIFNYVVPRLAGYYRMSNSLALASEVQSNLLPPGNPDVAGIDIAGKTVSCDETGGDYYDFLIPETQTGVGRLGVVVGDVSDHGIASALLMASARAFLRQRSVMGGDIAAIVGDVNNQLVRDVETSGRFMTLFFLDIDREQGRIRWIRAGHDPGWLYDPGTGTFEPLGGKGLPLGIMESATFEISERSIAPGQILIIGTDGIWETHDEAGSMFGKARFKQLIRDHAAQSAEEIVDSVIASVSAFRHPARQEDDITLVAVKIEPLP